jgi:hypothetical protein
MALAAFVFTLRRAFSLQDTKKLVEKLQYVNLNEKRILEEKPNGFPDGGQYSDPTDFTGDLDIFGAGSIFQLLNRTTTSHGSQKLADSLKKPFLSEKKILEHQSALKQFTRLASERQLITAYGLLNEESQGNLHDIKSWLREPNRISKLKWLRWLSYLLPACNLAAFYYWLDTDNTGPILIGLALSFLLLFSFGKYIITQHKLISKKQVILHQYASILKVFSGIDTGDSPLLKQWQSTASVASAGIQRLARLSAAFDQRLNLVVATLVNPMFLYDIHCMTKLEVWKSDNHEKFDTWIENVANIEFLNSLASLAFNNPAYTYPVVVQNQPEIEARDMCHPLIPQKQSVPNSMTIGRNEKLIIVTGSNMSGKTTFLRSLGVNLVLAQCGSPVCAGYFSFMPMQIHSSIRVSDSLQENTSYFMAELKKLHNIVQFIKTKQPCLVLIDEILRGTNSDDKTHGSEQFIRKLITYPCLTLFATHDLSLSVLVNELEADLSNYCFESVIHEGELVFDYKLREGVARNKNASFLMQKMGIIDQPLKY